MAKPRSAKKTETAAAVNMALLAMIVEATNNNSFIYTNEADRAPMLAAELIVINEGLKNEAGEVATRATDKGIAAVAAATPAATPETTAQPQGNSNMTTATEQKPAAAAKPAFVVEKGIPVPTAKRGVGAGMYPFETMEVGDSFFVPATEEKPTPAKSLASTVSSATKRYADSDKRKFVVRSVEGGARVWREA